MALSRAVVSVASILLGLSAAAAQQAETAAKNAAASASSSLTNPPVFQGLMVDAKGKTVGRFFPVFPGRINTFVVRQINGVWVALQVVDLTSGFTDQSPRAPDYFYQSVDCVGEAYLPGSPDGGNSNVMAPVQGFVTAPPPATAPSIYFAGTPASVLMMKSVKAGGSCSQGNNLFYVGPAESVPVSSLALTLPFSIK
jgi:hypothetical protein